MEPERRTVKDLLVDAKDAAELMVDLAYAAVFFGDEEVAKEVLRLEEQADEILVEMRMICLIAARTREDAESLAGVLELAASIEEIADAAEEIARVELRNLGVPRELRDDLRHAAEVVARVRIREENQIEGVPLRELELPSRTGMWVIAVLRDVTFEFGPDGDYVLREGDVLFLQGPVGGVDAVRELAGGQPRELPPPVENRRLSNLDHAVDLCVDLKNLSEVAVGLAYSAILLRDEGLAAEVGVIENRTDALWSELEGWVLRAAGEVDDPDDLRGLLRLGSASERIADAAQGMTRLLEVEGPPHPVIAHALAEADEIVAEAIVGSGAEAEDKSLGELKLQTETGMEVLAIERADRWVYRPRSSQRLHRGDRLLAIGPEEGAPRLRAICGDERPQGEEGWFEPEPDWE
jgi:uncharacterized protein with PhoU and TrkA domain